MYHQGSQSSKQLLFKFNYKDDDPDVVKAEAISRGIADLLVENARTFNASIRSIDDILRINDPDMQNTFSYQAATLLFDRSGKMLPGVLGEKDTNLKAMLTKIGEKLADAKLTVVNNSHDRIESIKDSVVKNPNASDYILKSDILDPLSVLNNLKNNSSLTTAAKTIKGLS